MQEESSFPKFHRLLSHGKWSAKWLSGVLLKPLVSTFTTHGDALVFGLDDTIERRWGRNISKRGIYRDPVRSSKSHFVKCSGLRWLSLALLTGLPWLEAGVYWALPVMTTLCPSERFYESNGKTHKKLTDWARQMITWLARHTAALGRPVYLTGDGSFATFELFAHAQHLSVGVIARRKPNAKLYGVEPLAQPVSKRGPKPMVGKLLPSMEVRLADKTTVWEGAIFYEWYGKRNKEMLFASGVATWRQSNKVLIKVRWVLLKDPEGKLDPMLLACTDTELCAHKVVSFFVRR
jgi:hypothetical protein